MFRLSELEAGQLEAIRAFERETGETLIAFSPLRLRTADLPAAELERLRVLEGDLGVMLVAVSQEPPRPRGGRRARRGRD